MIFSETVKNAIKQSSLRGCVFLSLYITGGISKPIFRKRFGKWEEREKAIVQRELEKMKKEWLIEDGLDGKKRIVPMLRYPQGHKLMDEFVLNLGQYGKYFRGDKVGDKIVSNVREGRR